MKRKVRKKHIRQGKKEKMRIREEYHKKAEEV